MSKNYILRKYTHPALGPDLFQVLYAQYTATKLNKTDFQNKNLFQLLGSTGSHIMGV